LHWAGMSSFSIAMLAALWAYDGWNQMPMVAGEVQNPQRNIPRALITGMFVIIITYTALNLAYFLALPLHEITTSSSTLYRDAPPVATKAAETFLSSFGGRLISITFVISTLGALNGTILACARVPFAMARDGLFFSRFSVLSESARVPVFSIAIADTDLNRLGGWFVTRTGRISKLDGILAQHSQPRNVSGLTLTKAVC
jgi:basic amino acid/polyamine antiporter, APA family